MNDVTITVTENQKHTVTATEATDNTITVTFPVIRSLIKYGKLYVWNDLDFTKEFIDGMHVPSDAEWTVLTDYIQANYNQSPDNFGVGNHLKHWRQDGSPLSEFDTTEHPRWSDNATHYGRNTVRFGALPCGFRDVSGNYVGIGAHGRWWSSIEQSATLAWYRAAGSYFGIFSRSYHNKIYGYSVRCLRAATVSEQALVDGEKISKETDYDGNIYDLIKIGTQVWTMQNIAATHYIDGTAVTSYDYDDDDTNTFFISKSESIW